jgi:hypothetical protein
VSKGFRPKKDCAGKGQQHITNYIISLLSEVFKARDKKAGKKIVAMKKVLRRMETK